MTIPEQPEPSDATRFATRPKQRRKELVNATDNTLAKLRKETVGKALAELTDNPEVVTSARTAAVHRLEEGVWRQWVEDDRPLDPEMVAEQFARAEREYGAAIHNRAVIREYGITA
jgi:hypothetical protein